LSVLFVSNAGFLRPDSLATVKALCAGVLIRRNVGYDFGAWREGFEQLGLPREDTEFAVMANDSVYGPLRPVGEMLQRMDFAQADAWGCTETWQSRYHLQSYFLAFSPGVLASLAWRRFWSGVRSTPSKNLVIQRYEIGLSQALIRAGFAVRALWPYVALTEDVDLPLITEEQPEGRSIDPLRDVRRAHARHVRNAAVFRVPLNPTSDLWRQLLRAGFPFIKRELLRSNPSGVTDIVDWREVARAVSDADFAPIERDLQRVVRDRAA
jgi:Rhamnan synthesis protein F